MVKCRDEGPPALAVEELAESDLRAIHDSRASCDAGFVSPRQTNLGSPCLMHIPSIGRDFGADHRLVAYERQRLMDPRVAAITPLLECRGNAGRHDCPGKNARHPRAGGNRACRGRAPSGAIWAAASP